LIEEIEFIAGSSRLVNSDRGLIGLARELRRHEAAASIDQALERYGSRDECCDKIG
jgi:hypothetical protein